MVFQLTCIFIIFVSDNILVASKTTKSL